MSDPLLSVRNLVTTFYTEREDIRAVDSVSFTLEKKQTRGIVGESGSGKTVAARSILGLVDNPGRIHPESEIRYHEPAFVQKIARKYPERTFWGEDIDQEPDDAFVTVLKGKQKTNKPEVEKGSVDLVSAPENVIRDVRGSEIAMVPQDALSSLNPVYTVGNQIKELLRIHRGLRGAEATEKATELLTAVGIPDPGGRLSEYPHQFSGGMQQRAVIALALACDPAVLICDEPTTALDVTIQDQILDLINELQRENDLAIMFITHNIGVVAEISDVVSVMYAGEVVEQASVSNLFDEPKHPYTRGLLDSIPGRASMGERLPTIEGSVPTAHGPATACRFAPRCPKATEDCHEINPTSVNVSSEHTASCLLYPEHEPPEKRHSYHEKRTDLPPTPDNVQTEEQ